MTRIITSGQGPGPARIMTNLLFQAHGISDTMWQMYRPLAYRDTWSVIPMLLRPKSRGRVLLRSNNPYDKPIFHAGYFTHPEDIKVLVEGVKIALAMAQTQAFSRMGTKFWDEVPIPGCEHTSLWSDEYWTCMARQYTTTIYHHSGELASHQSHYYPVT